MMSFSFAGIFSPSFFGIRQIQVYLDLLWPRPGTGRTTNTSASIEVHQKAAEKQSAHFCPHGHMNRIQPQSKHTSTLYCCSADPPFQLALFLNPHERNARRTGNPPSFFGKYTGEGQRQRRTHTACCVLYRTVQSLLPI